MKRRSFLQKMGLGVGYSVIPGTSIRKKTSQKLFNPYLSHPKTIDEAKTKEGFVIVRLAFEGQNLNSPHNLKGNINIKNGELLKLKSYLFEPGYDEVEAISGEYNLSIYQTDIDVIVLWIKNPTNNTLIEIKPNNKKFKFSLSDLLSETEIIYKEDSYNITCNLLFDKEIGKINLQEFGIDTSKENFRFALMADPQGGDPNCSRLDSPTRMKIHNAFIEESIKRCNELDPQPEFNIVIGDYVDSKGQMENFVTMNEYFKKLKCLFLLELGNHETEYTAKFSPGYNQRSLDNYYTAQKSMNGLTKLLYSYDLGKWHFIIWPDPLRSEFWPRHPHYFEWLERDLETHKNMLTIVVQHIPVHPIGINPLINYAESVEVKRTLINILSKHNNVKYVFSGHVHIPLKASIKTAVEMNGIKFINLPAAGFRPRAFGEEDFYGGPSQGIVYADIKGDDIEVFFKNVTREVYKYPKTIQPFDEETYPLWLNHKWEITSNGILINGDFEKGLTAWSRRYVYTEDENPSNICETREGMGKNKSHALYLYNRKREYDVPGQDRLPQTNNRICQVVDLKKGAYPTLTIRFRIDDEHYNPDYLSGAFFWIEGFQTSLKRLNLCYSIGKMYMNIGGKYSQINTIYPTHIDVPTIKNNWNELQLNLALDHERNNEHTPFSESNINKLAINIGVWTINDGYKHECGIYVDEVKFDYLRTKEQFQSNVNGNKLRFKDKKQLWASRIDHVSGEHQYASQEELYPMEYSKTQNQMK